MSESLMEEKLYWAITHGIVMANSSDGVQLSSPGIRHAPISLKPFDIPKKSFRKAIELCQVFNILIDKVSRDTKWLLNTLDSTAANDPFTKKLIDLLMMINDSSAATENKTQHWCLAINRSDYMQHVVAGDPRDMLQVEINTIASSFGALSTRITEMHQAYSRIDDTNIPDNNAIYGIVDALAKAHQLFIQMNPVVDAVVLMIVQPNEKNFSDQRLIQQTLLAKHNIYMIRGTLADLHNFGTISETNLLFRGRTVSLAYFRSGYSPSDYPTDSEWSGRLLVEKSSCIKCPNIAYHLTGTKKVQQVLSSPGVLEYFLGDDDKSIQSLRSVFAGLYSLDPVSQCRPDEIAARARALETPNLFVIKPQREGGGNNFYGQDIVRSLTTMNEQELSGYRV